MRYDEEERVMREIKDLKSPTAKSLSQLVERKRKEPQASQASKLFIES